LLPPCSRTLVTYLIKCFDIVESKESKYDKFKEGGKKQIRIFWYMTPCILVYRYRHIRESCYFNFQATTRIQVLDFLNPDYGGRELL
jgi:hypothetical protein